MTDPKPDEPAETYILSDEEHLRCLIAGADRLGLVPTGRLDRVSRVRFEQVANGAVVQLWLRPAAEPKTTRRKKSELA